MTCVLLLVDEFAFNCQSLSSHAVDLSHQAILLLNL